MARVAWFGMDGVQVIEPPGLAWLGLGSGLGYGLGSGLGLASPN